MTRWCEFKLDTDVFGPSSRDGRFRHRLADPVSLNPMNLTDTVWRLNNMADFDQELDARGLNCPLPILRAKKALNTLESGQVLKIIATDPGSVKDFEAFANQTGNELLESSEANGEFHFLMKKSA
jgi:tRNA 2-thiouridine synthesizing protein A